MGGRTHSGEYLLPPVGGGRSEDRGTDVARIARAAPIVIGENQAVTQWCRTATDRNGTVQKWFGVDLYTFRDGMIAKKDTYIKNVTR